MHADKVKLIINDLIEVNNDRIAGYEKAMEACEDPVLLSVFQNCRGASIEKKKQLIGIADNFNSEYKTNKETTVGGRIHRSWMAIKTDISSNNKKAVLESCEFGEDIAQKEYGRALEYNPELPIRLKELIYNQKQELKEMHDNIKQLRDKEL